MRCDLSRRLARKITKRIHSSKPASLKNPVKRRPLKHSSVLRVVLRIVLWIVRRKRVLPSFVLSFTFASDVLNVSDSVRALHVLQDKSLNWETVETLSTRSLISYCSSLSNSHSRVYIFLFLCYYLPVITSHVCAGKTVTLFWRGYPHRLPPHSAPEDSHWLELFFPFRFSVSVSLS